MKISMILCHIWSKHINMLMWNSIILNKKRVIIYRDVNRTNLPNYIVMFEQFKPSFLLGHNFSALTLQVGLTFLVKPESFWS